MSFSEVSVALQRLPHGRDLPLPQYESDGAAGLDLLAAVDEGEEVVLQPGMRDMIPTGLAMALPFGYEAQIRPRSGLAAKNGITALNSPGTIDCDYRGEVKVILINHGQEAFAITRGMRIAQMVIAPVTRAVFEEQDALPETGRGAGGFGSTGTGRG
ncbi:MAG: dUTP diphosphatase [Parvibaculaceae bacterium]